MPETFDLQAYLTAGVETVVKDALRATLRDPRESAFLTRFAAASVRASRRRAAQEKEGLHVPSYLIASITSSCNLHCAGCYSRCSSATTDEAPVRQLTGEEWHTIFREAQELGISFVLLAGGEPLLRRDVIEAAGSMPDTLFPIFTNGTFLNDEYLRLFERCRNLVPVLSIEGDRAHTDARRGAGVYDQVRSGMEKLHKLGLLFGASVTVTTENVEEVTSAAFLDSLAEHGCRLVIYVEYVPVTDESRELAPDDGERDYLARQLIQLRSQRPEMVFVSFPGDEKSSGGCMAAGRGFFHINSHGGAEPCPFSPYSDINVRDTSLREAMSSSLFLALRDGGILLDDHIGGCVLNEKRAQVEALLNQSVR